MLKNMKIYHKLLISFGIIDVVFLVTVIMAYQGCSGVLEASDPASYLKQFNTRLFLQILVIIATMLFIEIHIGRTLCISMEVLQKAALQIASGDVNVELTQLGHDEFGELMEAFQKVVDNAKYQSQIAEEVAGGNLTIEVKSRGQNDALGNALEKMVQKNHNSLSNINDAAMQVSASSHEVAEAAESLAHGSTGQASAIEEITASIDDIANKTKKNAEEANKVASMMSNAIEDVKHGNEQMKSMTVAMEEINKSSEGISNIIKVIDDIAFQTNILALNAAVEAARAGEAGKGFAVVAEEVRNLAAKSAAAAAETAEMIEDSIQKVGIGSDIVQETAVALEKITSIVRESESLINGIAEQSNYQATAIAQIDQAVDQVSQVVQTNSATSQECAAASEELSNQAERMRELLSEYKLDAVSSKPSIRLENVDHDFERPIMRNISLD